MIPLLKNLFSLAEDALEALVSYADPWCAKAADEIWDWAAAERLAEKEAEIDAWEPCLYVDQVEKITVHSSPAAQSAPTAAGESPATPSSPSKTLQSPGIQLSAEDLFAAARVFKLRSKDDDELLWQQQRWAARAERFEAAAVAVEDGIAAP